MDLKKYILLLLFAFMMPLSADTPSHCLAFDGVSNYVYIDNTPLKMNKYLTVEFWFKVDSFVHGAGMIDNGTEHPDGIFTGYSVYTADSNRIIIRLGNGASEVSVSLDSIPAGRWKHLAFTYDRYKNDDNIVVFLNGRVVEKGDCLLNLEYPFSYDPYGFHIGKYRSGANDIFFKGSIDELRLWGYVRSNREIRNNAASALDTVDSRLKGYYTFDQSSGNILTDLSPSANHGQLNDMQDSCWQLSYAQLMTVQPSDILFRRIVLSWDCSPAYHSFFVDLSENADFSSSLPGFPAGDVNTAYYILDDIDPGTYYYRVKGHYDGETPDSEPWTESRSVSTVTDVATPVDLSFFSAEWNDNNVEISWQTESQTEHAWFILQRRENSEDWTDIYRCKGAGTTTETFSYGYSDHSVIPGKKYRYRLRNISYSGEAGSSDVYSVSIPESQNPSAASPRFFLKSVYPNPFNPRISIDFSVLRTGRIRVTVHSLRGKCTDVISDKIFAPGEHRIHWEPGDLPAGIYILRIADGKHHETHKLLYMK